MQCNAGGVHITHYQPDHVLPTNSPSSTHSLVYKLYCLRMNYTSSRVSWFCTSLTDVQTVLLRRDVALRLLTRGDAWLGSTSVRLICTEVPLINPLPVTHGCLALP